ncbi:hypothetical protein BpHYR1_010924 [Brachionus plicatilis]|uniref:VWFA domain-containing protein n=1 Tax=Brachionus plicatilis TaxID=10195 RepID=A0A3M7QV12_BRAPC|nr:hypothetical protein BpHYR1_010924 [Brachionus plicatilis]
MKLNKVIFFIFLTKLSLEQKALDIDLAIDCSPKSANVLFLIDASPKVNSNTFTDLLFRIIPTIIQTFNEHLSKFFLSILRYTDRVIEIIPLQKIDNPNLITSKLISIEKETKTSNAIRALDKSAQIFQATKNNVNLCIWFTDGLFDDRSFPSLVKKADNLKNSCQMLLFNFGPNGDVIKLRRLASANNFVYKTQDIDAFLNKSIEIFNFGCINDSIKKLSFILFNYKSLDKNYKNH